MKARDMFATEKTQLASHREFFKSKIAGVEACMKGSPEAHRPALREAKALLLEAVDSLDRQCAGLDELEPNYRQIAERCAAAARERAVADAELERLYDIEDPLAAETLLAARDRQFCAVREGIVAHRALARVKDLATDLASVYAALAMRRRIEAAEGPTHGIARQLATGQRSVPLALSENLADLGLALSVEKEVLESFRGIGAQPMIHTYAPGEPNRAERRGADRAELAALFRRRFLLSMQAIAETKSEADRVAFLREVAQHLHTNHIAAEPS